MRGRRVKVAVVTMSIIALGACGAQFSDEEARRAAAKEFERSTTSESRHELGGDTLTASSDTVPVGDEPRGRALSPPTKSPETQTSPSGESEGAVVAGAQSAEPTGVVKSVEPRCVERPGTVTITVQTGKLADVSYGVAFSDGEHYNQWGLGQADFEGKYVFRVTVPLDAPEGVATVVVGATNVEGEGGPGSGQFLVAGAEGC